MPGGERGQGEAQRSQASSSQGARGDNGCYLGTQAQSIPCLGVSFLPGRRTSQFAEKERNERCLFLFVCLLFVVGHTSDTQDLLLALCSQFTAGGLVGVRGGGGGDMVAEDQTQLGLMQGKSLGSERIT